MKSRYNSAIQNQQFHIPIEQSKTHRTPRYQPRSPPIIEIYDLEALEIDNSQSNSLSSSSSSSNENFGSPQSQSYFNRSISSKSRQNSSSSPSSISLYSDSNPLEEPFTFQEFISSIINCNDKEWHKLIIQDLARVLEHNFKDFKKAFTKQSQNHIHINTDLFTYIAQKVFELASEEPNGVLGALISLKLECHNGQVFEICNGLAYDSSTMPTFQISITLKEDLTSFKKIFQTFKWYSNIGKYFSLHVDSKNFDIKKVQLYDY